MVPIRGIIFDKDGTLFNFNATWGAWTQGMIDDLAKGDLQLSARLADVLGYEPGSQSFRPGSIVIAETTAVVAAAILPYLADVTLEDLVSQMRSKSAQVPQVHAAQLLPLMQEFKAAGLVLGVVTNDAEAPALVHLSRAGIAPMMDFVAGYDSGHGAKPAPDPLLAFCAATGVMPGACIMVGDSLHDLHAGQAAGMETIGVLTGPALASDLAPVATAVLGSIAELPDWLKSRNAAS